ncbi:hypothetical protein KR032_010992 [Drosophila birchii]|nr:hypothetical protein KR032_010992 [Drosophila birchii]
MSEPKSIALSLESTDEVFEAPFDNVVAKKLVIGNPHNIMSVVFKVIPNTSRVLLVNPETGMLGPKMEISVDILMESYVPEPNEARPSILIKVTHVTELKNLPSFKLGEL